MAQLYLCLSPLASRLSPFNFQLSTLNSPSTRPLLALGLYRDLIVT